jgi:transposase
VNNKVFREWNPHQQFLLPPSVLEFVPTDHVAHFLRNVVVEELDLSALFESYKGDKGYPPFHPAMMTAVLLYAYTQGIYSSRKIAKACCERVDFMAISGMQRPDFRTVNDFRKRHLESLAGMFLQVLELCRTAGLCKLGHVALDGTKIKANASKHKAMSYGRMKEKIPAMEKEIAQWFAEAERADRSEDKRFGKDQNGDELPEWVKNKELRLAKMKEAKAALEAEQRQIDGPDQDPEPPRRGPKRKRPNGVPEDKAQRNFTDPDSRIMKSGDGFVQGYNAQAAVDSENQIIVAIGLTNNGSDNAQLLPMTDAIKKNLGFAPSEISADSGYASEDNFCGVEKRKQRAYVATGRQKHGKAASVHNQRSDKPLTRKMAARLKRGGFRSRYRLRKITVEPVFGQVKSARGFRTFSLRGKTKVTAEWSIVCAAHNLLKLAASRR